jgi:hypothetical protein
VRIDTAEAPAIDGDLSDPVWSKATVIDRFIQKRPNPGMPATERTVLRIVYDENNLYFAIYAYDNQPDRIIPGPLQRDGNLGAADSIVLLIDPFLTRRNAYGFEVSAAGARRDELEQNNTVELPEWDAIWNARARVVQDGWVAEIAIPFRSLSYDPNQTTWGLRHVAARSPQERARLLVGPQPCDLIQRCQRGGQPDRHLERQSRHRPRRAGLRRAAHEARLASSRQRSRHQLHRRRQRLLQDHARAH